MNKIFSSAMIMIMIIGTSALPMKGLAQNVDDPVIISQRVFILQNYVDNFNFGLNAGGELNAFGNVLGEFTLEDGEGNGLKPHPDSAVDTAANLSTRNEGFGTGDGEGFILIQKTFASTTTDGNSIDASSFNAISYYVKNDGNNSTSSATVAIELRIGDGGLIPGDSETDSNTGSTWTQTTPKAISSIVTGSDNDFERIVLALEGSVEGVVSGFQRTVGPADGNTHLELTSELLQDITAVNVVLNSGGESGTQRAIFIDDINFFNNFNMEVTQQRVFVPATGTDTVFVTATLIDAAGPVVSRNICFVVNGDTDNRTCVVTNTAGEAFFGYVVTTDTEIVTIDVEPM